MRARKVLRVLGYIGLGLVGLVALVVVAVLVVARSDFGHRKLLQIALPLAQDALTGRLEVGGLEGDLLHRLALRDVVVRDAEGEVAVKARRVAATYNLLALLGKTVHVTSADGEGLFVRARFLKDGRLNLATLAKPSTKPKSAPTTLTIRVSDVRVAADVVADLPRGLKAAPKQAAKVLDQASDAAARDAPREVLKDAARQGQEAAQAKVAAGAQEMVEQVRGSVRAHAGVVLRPSKDEIEARLHELAVAVTAPAAAQLNAHGGFTQKGEALAAQGVELALRTDGDAINYFVPEAKLRGPYAVTVKGDGPLQDLAVALALRPPAGTLDLDGHVGATVKTLPWRFNLRAQGLDPHEARADLPAAQIALQASGNGAGISGEIQLAKLLVTALQAQLQVRGRFTLDGMGEAEVDLEARDLSALSQVGAPKLAGEVSLHAKARRGAEIAVDATAHGSGLRAAGARVGRFDLEAHTVDLHGRVRLSARDLAAGGMQLHTLGLFAQGDQRELTLEVNGSGPQQTALRVAMHGTALYREAPATLAPAKGPAKTSPAEQLYGADLNITEIALRKGGQHWRTEGPAHVRIDPAVTLKGLALSDGKQRLAIPAASFVPKSSLFAVALNATHLDARRLADLAGAGAKVPTTDLELRVQAGGTPKAPRGSVKLAGTSSPLPALRLPAARLDLTAQLGADTVQGQVALSTDSLSPQTASGQLPAAQAPAAQDEAVQKPAAAPKDATAQAALPQRLRFNARFTVPLRPEAKLALEADARLPLDRLRPFLPPQLEALRGLLTLNARAAGTLQAPEFDVQVRIPTWVSAVLRGQATELTVAYKDARLDTRLATQVQTTEGKPIGSARASLSVPVRLSSSMNTAALMRDLPTTQVTGRVNLQRIDLGEFFGALLAARPPVRGGQLNAQVDLAGTLYKPQVDVHVTARGVTTPTVTGIDAGVALRYAAGLAALDANLYLHGGALLQAHGETRFDAREAMSGQVVWTTLPVHFNATIPDFDLARLSKDARGRIAGRVSAQGTAQDPRFDALINAKGMNFQEWPIGNLYAYASFDGKNATARLLGDQPKGGRLRVDAAVPIDAEKPLNLALVANSYVLDYAPRARPTTGLRVLRGQLNADLHVEGPRKDPRPHGSLRVQNGAIGLATDPRLYRGVNIDLGMTRDGEITLRDLSAQAEVGKARLTGSAKLDGLRPVRVDAKLTSQRFPISGGAIGLWIDTEVDVTARTEKETLVGKVTVNKGTVYLPKIATGKSLQKLGPLDDVAYVDRLGLAEQARLAKEKAAQAAEAPPPLDDLPTRAVVRLRIPGPLYIRGREVNASAEGSLKLEVRGGLALISGSARVPNGWIELLGKRYEIDRAVVSLDGSVVPDPRLDVRISRRLTEATIVIEVHGTALKPEVVLRSDPPIYSQSQVIAILLTGDPADQRGGQQSLDQRALGAVSGLIIGQIKDVIADSLPIDVLKVDVGGEGYNVFGQTRIEVGKYLTDDLYVGYSHQFGQRAGTRRTNSNQVQMEYRFLRKWALETLFGDAGVGSIDLYWTRRF